MPQYLLYKKEESGMVVGIVFLEKDEASAFAYVAKEIGVPLENGTFDEWKFYNAGANELYQGNVLIFPRRASASTIILAT
ncbi:MAG: hypothetical protein Q7R59_01200 [bacterium]|nr:hypothetical protein [bacterium]